MSGRKYTQVELDAARAMALENGDRAMEAVGRCEQRIAEFEAAVEAESDVPNLFRDLLVKLHQAAREARQQCDLARETLKNTSLDMDAVERQQKDIADCTTRLDTLDRQVRTCLSGLGIETRCEAFRARVENERDRFRLWDSDRYDRVAQDARSVQNDLRNALGRGEGVEGFGERLDETVQQWEMLVEDVEQREHQNRRREMVIEAIEGCCEKLGYTASRCQQPDPNKAIELAVDTKYYGKILFTLELDGPLRSQSDVWLEEQEAVFEGSEKEQAPCKHWVNELTERMKANYGMELEFRYQDSEKPEDQSRTAKGLPVQKSQDQAQSAEGHSGA